VIPAGYETQYIAQADVALSRFTQGAGAEDACAWNLLGLLQERQGLHRAAVKSFARCTELIAPPPSNTANTSADDARTQMCTRNLARAKCNSGDVREAMMLYQSAGASVGAAEHFSQLCGLGYAASLAGVRCAFSDRILHSMIPLDHMHVREKRTCV
jgi:hypothetical protein